MQNDDEELRGLEKKLGPLIPRDMNESQIEELAASLDREDDDITENQAGGIYPANVLWMRFAPVAAAACVVLMGTFLLRYESHMGELQSQRNDSAKMSGGTVATNKANSPGSEVNGVINSGLTSLPVPRLGVGEEFGVSPNLSNAGLLPVSGQNYLQPAGEVYGEFNRVGIPIRLHFEDAYDWQDVPDSAEASGAEDAQKKR